MNKNINPNWGILFLSVAVICSSIGGGMIYEFMTILYYIIACSSLILLPTIMNMAYHPELVQKHFIPMVFNGRTREEVIELVNTSSFINLPVFLNMCCGVYFYYIMENTYLFMSLLLFIFHFRIIHLIIKTTTINHLYNTEEAGEDESC
jgi:hypothetical protein